MYSAQEYPIVEGEGVEESRQMPQNFESQQKHSVQTQSLRNIQNSTSHTNGRKNTGTGPPYTKGRFDVIEYIIVPKRWQNAIKNVYSDIWSGIDTDHYPIIADIRVSLNAEYRYTTPKTRYIKCTDVQQDKLEQGLKHTQPTEISNTNITKWIKKRQPTL